MAKTTKEISSTTEPKKEGVTSSMSVAFDKTIELIKKNGFGLFLDLLKINLIAGLVGIVLVLILAILWLPLLEPLVNVVVSLNSGEYDQAVISELMSLITGPNTIFTLIISVVIAIIFSVLSTPLSYIQYNAIDLRANNSTLTIGILISRFRENFLPVISYTLLTMVIALGLFAIPIISFLVGFTNPIIMLIGLGTALVSVITLIIFSFLIQFSPYELVIKRKGVVDSLKSSYKLVKSNIGSVFLFDVLLFILSAVIGIVLSIVTYPAQLVLQFGILINPLLAYMGYFVVNIILEALTSSVLLAVILPLFYFFWKNISGELDG